METDPFREPSFTYLFLQKKQEPHFKPIDPNLNPCSVKELSVNQTSYWISTGALQPQIQASLDRKIAILKGSKLHLGFIGSLSILKMD
jgi:hypothetical protein